MRNTGNMGEFDRRCLPGACEERERDLKILDIARCLWYENFKSSGVYTRPVGTYIIEAEIIFSELGLQTV